MDQLELLNVLDVIKNEEVYSKRLEELKKVEKQIQDARYVNATMEEADRLRSELAELKERAEENLKCIEEEVRTRVRSEEDRLSRLDKDLAAERERLESWSEELIKTKSVLDEASRYNSQKKLELQEWEKQVNTRDKNLREWESTLTKKIKRVNEAFQRND